MISGITFYEYIGIVAFASLCVGSFINVVVYRLPKIMLSNFRCEARDILGLDPVSEDNVGIALPRSSCPKCGHFIKAIENIPVLSYVMLRGRCSNCKQPISIRYPLVELSTLFLSIAGVMLWPNEQYSYLALPWTWALITILLIDMDHKIVPDAISLPLLWGGILISLMGLSIDLEDAVQGAMVGYFMPWSINKGFEILRNKQGMGSGDFKLLAAIGAWSGYQGTIDGLFIGGLIGMIIAVFLWCRGKVASGESMPFAPFIIIAAWYSMLFNPILVPAQ